MDIKLSPKYKPLFQLLGSWDKDKSSRLSKVDTVLISGGRDSGKSWGVVRFLVLAALLHNHRILYTRYTMSSSANSITSGLKSAIDQMGLNDEFIITGSTFECKKGKGSIVITGQKTSQGTASAKLKSLSDFSMFITEEAEEIAIYEEFKKVKRSIRSLDVQPLSILIFNPPTRNHFLYKEFYEGITSEDYNGLIGNTMYINTTYLDNINNMTESNLNDYESLRLDYEYYLSLSPQEKLDASKKLVSRYKEYKNACLGFFRDSSEGTVFEYKLGEFIEDGYPKVYGMDIGFTHPSTVIQTRVDKDRKVIYLKEVFYKTGQVSSSIYADIKSKVTSDRIWCDSASPMVIKELKNLGLNIKACVKPKIVDSINAMLAYEIIVDPQSLNLIKELNMYKWSESNKDYPEDNWNHCIDSARYAFTHIMDTKVSQQKSYRIL